MKKSDRSQSVPNAHENQDQKQIPRKRGIAGSTPENQLREAIRGWHLRGLNEGQLAQEVILELLLRIENMFAVIDHAFAYQPFIPTIAPDAQANQSRVNAYFTYFARATKLLEFAVTLVDMINEIEMAPPNAVSNKTD
jgi:hypothetical protein